MGKLITFVVAGVALVVWVTGIFVWLSAHRLDTTPFVLFLGTVVGTGVPSLINLWNSFATHKAVKDTAETMTQVEANTNGKLAEQFQDVKDHIDQMGGE